MLSELGRMPTLGKEGSFGDDFEKEIGLLLREQRRQEADDREKELNLYRSGSAPPTVEGSLSAIDGLFGQSGSDPFQGFVNNKNGNGFASEDELRSDPAYLSYYYSNVNLNPRLPPPLLSKEDWRFSQRLKGGSSALGGIEDRRMSDNGGSRSMYSMPPGFNSRREESKLESEKLGGSTDWAADGLVGLPGLGLGSKQKSFAEIFQDDLVRPTPVSMHPSRPASRNALDDNVDNTGPPASYSYAAAVGGSLSRSTTPDPQFIPRAPSPCITPIGEGRASASEKRGVNSPISFNGVPSRGNESDELVAALSGMNLSKNGAINEENRLGLHVDQISGNQHPYLKKPEAKHADTPSISQSAKTSYSDMGKSSGSRFNLASSSLLADRRVELNKSATLSGSSYLNGGGLSSNYQNVDSTNASLQNYGLSGYSMNPALASIMASQLGTGNLPPLFENAASIAVPGMDSRMLGGGLAAGPNLTSPSESQKMGTHMAGSALQAPFVDPMYVQYLRTTEYAAAAQLAALSDPSVDRNYVGNSYMDLLGLQNAYLGSLLSPQKSQYGVSMGSKSRGSHQHGYYGNPAYGVGMSYPGSPLASPIPNSPVGPGSPIRHNDFNMRYASGMRNLARGVMGPWHLDSGCGVDDNFASSLLEEFKSNKTKCFELCEIAGHVVDFSADQYGSRFIQQKLETATTEEKNMVYEEIFPQALSLMTDVFGNYVIQKFFEHGLPDQRRELASKLYGHVLTLSLQMYGCRVIQKAIEVVDLDQKIKMVGELDGHIIRCVRDQNGNHVIQKCIECVPEEHIHFIISIFFDQVVTLSAHPYGCRVIQRVLEHCNDPNTQSKVMGEILGSVSMLAQDQYGNYVVQHVLEHGKPHERSTIIEELAGKIVQMSQQKFASNVVEKCLTFGGPDEHQLLVNEILGSTDENEPLQAMMKDQFANYVVQKVLETCDDQQRELIMTRIKVHLNALKKYTYGKHIVARVEKLLTAGERRMAAQYANPA